MKDEMRIAVSYREAGRMLGLSERTVWELVRGGKLARVKIGRSVRIPCDSLKQFVESQTSQAGEAPTLLGIGGEDESHV